MKGTHDLLEERLPLTPAMRTYRAAEGRPLLAYGLYGVASGAVIFGALLWTSGVSNAMTWLIAAIFAGNVGLMIGALASGLKAGLSDGPNLSEGVYIRATGRIALQSEWNGLRPSYGLLVGDRRFGLLRGDFERLWAGLSGTAANRPVTPPTRFDAPFIRSAPASSGEVRARLDARAAVSYVARCGTLLEVRDEAGRAIYQHSLYRDAPELIDGELRWEEAWDTAGGHAAKTYAVAPKGTLVQGGVFLLSWGSIAAGIPTLWVLGLLRVNGKSHPTLEDWGITILLLAGAGCCYIGYRNLSRVSHTVNVTDRGEVVFHHVLGSTRVAVGDIRSIEKRTAPIQAERPAPAWHELHVRHARGLALIPDGRSARELITDLRALNPAIVVDGAADQPLARTTRVEGSAIYELRYAQADVFERPDVTSKRVGELSRSDPFEVLSTGTVRGSEHEFYRVRTSSGQEGFVFHGNMVTFRVES